MLRFKAVVVFGGDLARFMIVVFSGPITGA